MGRESCNFLPAVPAMYRLCRSWGELGGRGGRKGTQIRAVTSCYSRKVLLLF